MSEVRCDLELGVLKLQPNRGCWVRLAVRAEMALRWVAGDERDVFTSRLDVRGSSTGWIADGHFCRAAGWEPHSRSEARSMREVREHVLGSQEKSSKRTSGHAPSV